MISNVFHQRALAKIVQDPRCLREALEKDYSGGRVVLVKGVFDLLHTGHYYSFVNARTYGDVLVVGVNSDSSVRLRKGEGRPVVCQSDRMLMVAALGCVDWVTLYEGESPYEMLRVLKPDVFAASHFDSLTPDQQRELQTQTAFQIIPKQGDNSTTRIIERIKGCDL